MTHSNIRLTSIQIEEKVLYMKSIILAGLPVFLKYENGEVKTVERVEEATRILKPPHGEHYPYEPYEFENMNEVLNYVERAGKESIDSLYLQAKQIATDYNDQKKDKVNLLAIEIICHSNNALRHSSRGQWQWQELIR